MKIHLAPRVIALLSAVLMGIAWWYPSTPLCAALGWCAVAALLYSLERSATPYRDLYLAGVLTNILGFYWLFFTIKEFGGFWTAPALAIALLFATVSALQYVIFVFIYKNLPQSLERIACKGALAWVMAELVSIRIFPWHAGHTQIAFKELAQVADIGGTLFLSFIMFSSVESVFRISEKPLRRSKFAIPLLLLALSILYGRWRIDQITKEEAPSKHVAVIQANISLVEKHNIKLFLDNSARYFELSKAVSERDTLVVWPESVIQSWIADDTRHVREEPRLPFLNNTTSLLVGGLTHRGRANLYNSAVAIFKDGSIPPPYHKRILMPFGEFTPFGETFPWLKEINATAGNFTPGKEVVVFKYPGDDSASLNVSPLICYEDVIPSLAGDSVRAGANLLVNITNDAWFGDTAAPHQHHMIASFRAIETRRFLVRSTNTGLSAVVSATGETTTKLPVYREGVLKTKVKLLETPTIYTTYKVGDKPWWFLFIVICAFIAYRKVRPEPQ